MTKPQNPGAALVPDAPARITTNVTRRDAPVSDPTTSAQPAPAKQAPATSDGFAALGLAKPILAALLREGYTTPTPIQERTIVPALAGRDILGCAQTGTGKTAAFALPIIHLLNAEPIDKTRRGPAIPRALVLAPTRELASQIADSFLAYGSGTGLTVAVVYGGVSQRGQEKALSRGVDVLVACPGRLIDLMEQRLVNLTGVRTLVLDEADRMLDMGFIQPIRRIAADLVKDRRTMLFSATMPKAVTHLAETLLRDPVRVSVSRAPEADPKITQSVYQTPRHLKQPLLEHLLRDPAAARTIVFTRTKHGADKVAKSLSRAGVRADAIHGNKNQSQRQRALDAFRAGRTAVLVATDVAARGIDVDDITHVINFDLPMEAEAYVHRIGRTGRAGAEGAAVAFCDPDERGLLRAIERFTGNRIPDAGPLPDLKAGASDPSAHAPTEPRYPAVSPERRQQSETPRPRSEQRSGPRDAGRTRKPVDGPRPGAKKKSRQTFGANAADSRSNNSNARGARGAGSPAAGRGPKSARPRRG